MTVRATNAASGIVTGSTTGIAVTGSAVVLANFGQVTGTTTGVVAIIIDSVSMKQPRMR